MLHANLRLAGIHQQTDNRVTLGCVTCEKPTAHRKTERDGKTVYRCAECGRKTVREWK